MSFDVLARAVAAVFIGFGILLVVPEFAGVRRLERLGKGLGRLGQLREGPFFRHRRPSPAVGASVCFLMLVGPGMLAFLIAFIPFSQTFANSIWVGVQIILPPLVVLYIAPVLVRLLLWWGSNVPGRVMWVLGLITALTGLGMLIERL